MIIKLNGNIVAIKNVPKGMTKADIQKMALEKIKSLMPYFKLQHIDYKEGVYIDLICEYFENGDATKDKEI